ncbi:MAG: bifunctional (p)ppGpp synthetase/guanosine-3',5'-bis(diphosphate) 3'-pyrophosphohydrolase [Eggerthellaceae bacterium]|nr:bifunctional (p)ppGpp synthetase/guanosine-3',5'-bis(diphosphate) 3'-pyrophosphohydrolase [Eggerthellaceae bacterium]
MPKDNLLEDAVAFAAQKHAGKYRKGSKLPYIVHPMEAAAICASFTDDVEVLAAAVLHDVVEDAGVTVGEIEERFGGRVAAIVAGESEDKREGLPPADTWKVRKLEGIEHVRNADDIGVKMVCLGDKLSNIRSIQRDYEVLGDALWQRFNQKDPAEHAWYYSAIADVLEGDLGHTEAWREYRERVGKVFGGLDA